MQDTGKNSCEDMTERNFTLNKHITKGILL